MKEKKDIVILGIDTSCDDTSAAIVKNGNILSNIISSQIEFHKEWQGVVPSLAKRLHAEKIDIVIKKAIQRAHVQSSDITHIAVTQGPGLAIALEVGINKAKELSHQLDIPLLPINHMEGHIYAAFARNSVGKGHIINPKFPYLALLISGGHTELHLMHTHGTYEKLGEKLDDAVGEAYDKVGRMLEIGYQGGPILEKFAAVGNPYHYNLPIPLAHSNDCNFSYSGLKTAVSRVVTELKEKHQFDAQNIYDLSAAFQYAAVSELVQKTTFALQQYPFVHGLIIGGGVSANMYVRKKLRAVCKDFHIPLYLPLDKRLCMDNGAMIGVAAYWRLISNTIQETPLDSIEREPRLSL